MKEERERVIMKIKENMCCGRDEEDGERQEGRRIRKRNKELE